MPPMQMTHVNDPVQEILENVGDLSGIDVFNNQVLVGIYIRPAKTKGGIILTNNTVDEDRYQGKVGLVLKVGNVAFEDANGEWFKDANLKVGDWVVFRPSDGWSVAMNNYPCRMLDDMSIRARIQHPDQVW